ncbi:bifunctional diguanylate cyclase/phosphodiesterase [Devosia sp.]|uniref:putative bifunctional diguanylate cyclase/phosphodiesterase n=1 Tax=Devosia sp. TaxID=1871048 RepID=UPI0027328046|nr:EAL domain-containing protein [Devosia sp.]MDP2781146.1 EAL domain-containing protein [Devosia sp.]
MRHLYALAMCLALALTSLAPALALEVISVPDDVNAVNLSDVLDVRPGSDGRVQLSTAPGADGIIRRIEVLASEAGTNPGFALFALRNESDQQIERLLVAPFYRLPGSGILQPDLGSDRVTALTPSAGIRPVRLSDAEADVFEVTLDPGATVTFVAELTGQGLPELYLWQPNAYRDYVNSFTLFRGVVLGVASLAAVFLTIMFVVKGRGVFPATAAVAWAVLTYLLIDFGVLGRLLGLSATGVQPLRAAAEAGIATTLAGFLFIYLNLHRWHLRFVHLALGLAALFLALFAFAFFEPAIAATIARLVLVLLGLSGFFLILLLALRGYDRAVLLVPTWIIVIAWLFYSWLVVSGQVSNDVAQPAVGGGLVLIVMLLGFTAVQHAFSEGQVTIGTLSEVERRALALTGSGDFVFDWNIERDRVAVSDELAIRLGEKRGALRGAIKLWLDRVHPDDRDRFRTAFDTLVELRRGKVSADMRVAGHDGNYRSFRMRVKPVLGGDGQVNRIVGTLQDVTEDRASRERLLHDAVHDSLTGLPNRQLLLDRLERALVRARLPGGTKPAVFLIDIDRFMELEERIGHAASDSVLLAISRRITRVMRPLDTVARITGDQFAVILASEQAAGKIAETAEQIRKALKAPFNFGDRDLTLTASIGVTIYDSNPAEAADVLRDAELAMYYAKRLGGDRIEAYRASARSIAAYNRASEEDLERGMKHGELHVQFQPVMDIQTNQMVGAEALMRWTHPTRGVVNPDEFVPLAERSGQIEKLGRLAFEQSAAQAKDWMTAFGLPEDFFISVNLSPTQLATETLLNDMRSLVSQDKELARHLKLEITESQVMTNPEHSAYMLQALRNLGLGLALDDFGTGHSSLSYLHRFPFDTIKIPQAFVKLSEGTGIAHTQIPIIKSIVTLASDLDLMVIAEGVESQEELERLRTLNCRYAQGYAFGAAMTGPEFGKKLATQLGR